VAAQARAVLADVADHHQVDVVLLLAHLGRVNNKLQWEAVVRM
jgi:2',3'-cyclic-nucleotide 2'-phosphodiesterase (5'-nucleotidase family)